MMNYLNICHKGSLVIQDWKMQVSQAAWAYFPPTLLCTHKCKELWQELYRNDIRNSWKIHQQHRFVT